ncbi:hypothetical protein [Streptomyces sp. NPDC056291]|uniref:hypothetical protein n=1 Tax=Streptomyces sp. NPDC056291 TaxID=3345772 RepID=UPI0035D8B2EE
MPDERTRDERIETLYQGWGAREMAERIVDLEDEIGEEKDGLCTGMHADVAEAHAAWEDMRDERDRARNAWRSARRRAADEANMGLEALELKREEISRLRAELDALRKSTYGAPRLEHMGADEDGDVWRLERR